MKQILYTLLFLLVGAGAWGQSGRLHILQDNSVKRVGNDTLLKSTNFSNNDVVLSEKGGLYLITNSASRPDFQLENGLFAVKIQGTGFLHSNEAAQTAIPKDATVNIGGELYESSTFVSSSDLSNDLVVEINANEIGGENLVTFSNQTPTSNGWSTMDSVIVNPYGTIADATVVQRLGTGVSQLRRSSGIALVDNQDYTVSFWIKKVSGAFSTVTIDLGDQDDQSISVTTDWTYHEVVLNASIDPGDFIDFEDAGGVAGNKISIYELQVERGNKASAHIKTGASSQPYGSQKIYLKSYDKDDYVYLSDFYTGNNYNDRKALQAGIDYCANSTYKKVIRIDKPSITLDSTVILRQGAIVEGTFKGGLFNGANNGIINVSFSDSTLNVFETEAPIASYTSQSGLKDVIIDVDTDVAIVLLDNQIYRGLYSNVYINGRRNADIGVQTGSSSVSAMFNSFDINEVDRGVVVTGGGTVSFMDLRVIESGVGIVSNTKTYLHHPILEDIDSSAIIVEGSFLRCVSLESERLVTPDYDIATGTVPAFWVKGGELQLSATRRVAVDRDLDGTGNVEAIMFKVDSSATLVVEGGRFTNYARYLVADADAFEITLSNISGPTRESVLDYVADSSKVNLINIRNEISGTYSYTHNRTILDSRIIRPFIDDAQAFTPTIYEGIQFETETPVRTSSNNLIPSSDLDGWNMAQVTQTLNDTVGYNDVGLADKVEMPDDNTNLLRESFTALEVGKTYLVSFYIHLGTEAFNNNLTFSADLADDPGNEIDFTNLIDNSVREWTYIGLVFKPNDSGITYSFLDIEANGETGDYFWIDKVMLREINSAFEFGTTDVKFGFIETTGSPVADYDEIILNLEDDLIFNGNVQITGTLTAEKYHTFQPVTYNALDTITVDTLNTAFAIPPDLAGLDVKNVTYTTNANVTANTTVRLLYYDVSANTYTAFGSGTITSSTNQIEVTGLTQTVAAGDWIYAEVTASGGEANGLSVNLRFQ